MQPPDSQSAVFAFLADPATHGLAEPVVRIDTHAACVFLAGEDAYKVKRAVKFPFLDFSTLEVRRRACENEVAVNRENAPGLYLGVVPIVRAGGRLRLGGSGEVVEWAVHLRRFDENQTLDRLADRGALDREVVAALADVIADAHRRAPGRDAAAALAALRRQTDDTLDELGTAADLLGGDGVVAAFAATVRRQFDEAEPLLLRRGGAGAVRRCHGDLHLRNIALIADKPVLFDAIEFDEAIATGDVLYDLAFLLMDLWQRGLHAEASLVLNRYLWRCEEEALQIEGLAALPLFLSLRAAIRAKVAAELARLTAADAAREDARRYFAAAGGFLRPRPVRLVGIGGLSGTGKTSLAARLAGSLGRPPGAVHLRSDIERKRLLGAGELERLPETAYSETTTAAVYRRLRELARLALDTGQSAIVDAVHLRAEERDALARVAADAGVSFVGLWLHGPTALLGARVAARTGDASDATAEVVRRQAALAPGANDWIALDAAQPPERVAAAARATCRSRFPEPD
jgi:aminoglycoside phosphotransferase family enzyme/predicted kinase